MHDRLDVEHSAVDVGQPLGPVGHARAALVEHDHAGKRPEPSEGTSQSLLLPGQLDMRDEAWDHHQIEGALTEDLVGDVDAIVGLRVAGLRHRLHMTI
jgi:hypothetical protein